MKKKSKYKRFATELETLIFFDIELKIAYYDIIKIVRQAYYEGYDAGVQTMAEIQAKNQELINNLFKNYNK